MEHANPKPKESEAFYDEPFREPLSESDLADTIKKLSAHPDKLVREWGFSARGESLEGAKKGIAMFRKMEKRYGIAIPKMDLLVGKLNGEIRLFTVVDKIEGKNLADVTRLPQEATAEVDNFLAAMAQFYFDVYREGGEYWWDFNLLQLVYGHKKGESENRVYIVDVEPRYYVYDKTKDKNNDVLKYLVSVAQKTLYLESKLKDKVTLQRSRDLLLKMAEDILKSDRYNHRAQDIKNHLKI